MRSGGPGDGSDDKVGPVTEKNPPAETDRGRADDRADDRADNRADDRAIDEADEESFPASDSPSSWSGPPGSSD